MTPLEATRTAYQRLVDVWEPLVPGKTLSLDNEKGFQPPSDGSTWARAGITDLRYAQGSLGEIGKRRFETVDLFWVQVFTPAGQGTTAALELATAVRDALEARSEGELDFLAGRIRRPRTDKASNGRWLLTLIETPISYAETK